MPQSTIGMERSRPWGWHMANMKEAGSLDVQGASTVVPQEAFSTLEPTTPGFTPINQRKPGVPKPVSTITNLEVAEKTSKSKSTTAPSRKRRQSQLSGPNAETKKQAKVPRQSKPKNASKTGRGQTQDIPQAFAVTKPGLATRNPFAKLGEDDDGSKPDVKLQATNRFTNDPSLISGGIVGQWTRPTPVGLGQTYQAAYTGHRGPKDVADDPRPNAASSDDVLGTSDQTVVEGVLDDDAFSEALSNRPANSGTEEDHPKSTGGCTRPTEPCHVITGNLITDWGAASRDSNAESIEQLQLQNALSVEAMEAAAFEEVDLVRPYRSSSEPAETLDDQQPVDPAPDVPAFPGPGIVQAPLIAFQTFLSDRAVHAHDDDDDDDGFPVGVDEFVCDNEFDEAIEVAHKNHAKTAYITANRTAQDPFDDDGLDAELMNLDITTPKPSDGQSAPFTQRTPTLPKLQWMPPTPYTPPKRSVPPSSLTNTTSPFTPITKLSPPSERSPNVPAHIVPSKDGHPVPFVRPPFPTPLLPRSPIMGLSPTTVLRTCFRIGEALNAASVSLRKSIDAIVELYCRVKYSDREAHGYKQFFELGDLFTPDKSPSLHGQYAIWKGVGLWEHDSRQFLGQCGRGKMARVIGRIKRGENNKGWEMNVLSVWEVDWEDIGIAKGVVCS